MLILFDHSMPAPLRYALKGHVVVEAVERGRRSRRVRGVCNGGQEHPVSAEFDGRKIGIVTLGNAQWPVLRHYVERVVEAVDATFPGSYAEGEIPFR
jgi:hypothetical protein